MSALPQPPFPPDPSPGPLRPLDVKPRSAKGKKILIWVALGTGALTVLVVLGLVVLLRSERVHAYLLRTAQQKATEALGTQAKMRDFALHWSDRGPIVDLYGIVIHGSAPYPDPPLLEADAIHLGVTVTSLLHKAWYVSDVRIQRPVARIFADRDGRTNLPSP